MQEKFISALVPVNLFNQLSRAAKIEDRSKSAVIRAALDKYFAEGEIWVVGSGRPRKLRRQAASK